MRIARGLVAMAVAVALAWNLGGTAARATVMVEVALEDMTREAAVIVHGRVERSRVQMRVRDGAFEPWTLTDIRVLRTLKSDQTANDRITIAERGGVHQGGGTWIDGTPRYAVGDEVVVFLRRYPDDSLRTFAMAQGRFRVRRGVPGVPASVVRDLAGLSFATFRAGQTTVQHAEEGEGAMALDSFLDHIEATLLAFGGAR